MVFRGSNNLSDFYTITKALCAETILQDEFIYVES